MKITHKKPNKVQIESAYLWSWNRTLVDIQTELPNVTFNELEFSDSPVTAAFCNGLIAYIHDAKLEGLIIHHENICYSTSNACLELIVDYICSPLCALQRIHLVTPHLVKLTAPINLCELTIGVLENSKTETTHYTDEEVDALVQCLQQSPNLVKLGLYGRYDFKTVAGISSVQKIQTFVIQSKLLNMTHVQHAITCLKHVVFKQCNVYHEQVGLFTIPSDRVIVFDKCVHMDVVCNTFGMWLKDMSTRNEKINRLIFRQLSARFSDTRLLFEALPLCEMNEFELTCYDYEEQYRLQHQNFVVSNKFHMFSKLTIDGKETENKKVQLHADLFALASPRVIARLGNNNVMKRMPSELIRQVGHMLG